MYDNKVSDEERNAPISAQLRNLRERGNVDNSDLCGAAKKEGSICIQYHILMSLMLNHSVGPHLIDILKKKRTNNVSH